ncbi:MAG: hypothetical protein PHU43_00020 [Candidatus Bipolaricaulis sp.]|nr:hypothetical protein [Candidatus Bipolaricaulis sp.]
MRPTTGSRIAALLAGAITSGVAVFFVASCAPHVPDEEPALRFGSLPWDGLSRT